MRFSTILLLPFVALTAVGTPTPELKDAVVARTSANEADGGRTLLSLKTDNATAATTDERRIITVYVTANNVRYRTCASTSCTAVGQYHQGQELVIHCWVVGQVINGNPYWSRIESGYFISEYYVSYQSGTYYPVCP